MSKKAIMFTILLVTLSLFSVTPHVQSLAIGQYDTCDSLAPWTFGKFMNPSISVDRMEGTGSIYFNNNTDGGGLGYNAAYTSNISSCPSGTKVFGCWFKITSTCSVSTTISVEIVDPTTGYFLAWAITYDGVHAGFAGTIHDVGAGYNNGLATLDSDTWYWIEIKYYQPTASVGWWIDGVGKGGAFTISPEVFNGATLELYIVAGSAIGQWKIDYARFADVLEYPPSNPTMNIDMTTLPTGLNANFTVDGTEYITDQNLVLNTGQTYNFTAAHLLYNGGVNHPGNSSVPSYSSWVFDYWLVNSTDQVTDESVLWSFDGATTLEIAYHRSQVAIDVVSTPEIYADYTIDGEGATTPTNMLLNPTVHPLEVVTLTNFNHWLINGTTTNSNAAISLNFTEDTTLAIVYSYYNISINALNAANGSSLSIPMKISDAEYYTPISVSLPVGTYIVQPEDYGFNTTHYWRFVNWTDGADRTRTINFTGPASYTAYYQLSKIPSWGGYFNFFLGLAGLGMMASSWFVLKWQWDEKNYGVAILTWMLLLIVGFALCTILFGG